MSGVQRLCVGKKNRRLQRASGAYTAQRGLTLIELMLAIGLGLFVSAMVVQLMVGSSRIFGRQSSSTMVESNARFATAYLSQYVRQAGTRKTIGTTVPFYIDACDGWNPCTRNGSGIQSDRIAVQMYPDDGLDCTGNVVPNDLSVINVFYIANNDIGVSALHCRGYDQSISSWFGPGLAIVDGVENMQVLYGVADADENITGYFTAANVPPVDGNLLEGWDQVRSVKVGLVVADGTTRGGDGFGSGAFQLFDSGMILFADNKYRQSFTTTVLVNSKQQ